MSDLPRNAAELTLNARRSAPRQSPFRRFEDLARVAKAVHRNVALCICGADLARAIEMSMRLARLEWIGMTVEIRGNLAANNLLLSEKFRRYSTGTILFAGEGARVEIDGPIASGDLALTIGSGTSVTIGQDCVIGRLSLNLFGEGAQIDIGRSVGFAGTVNLSTHEGARISIGAHCLIAGDTVFAASDGHPVFDVATGERINMSSDIRVGEHVWIGARAMVLKGASIGRDSVVGAGSIVTGGFGPNSLIVGNPARLLRSGINWRE